MTVPFRQIHFRYEGPWIALVLVGLGLWLLVREIFGLGPWFGAATLAAIAGYFTVRYVWGERRLESLVAAWVLWMWALYVALGALFGAPLPAAFFFVLIGLGFVGVYFTGTRPATWPLIPASALFALATFVWVVGVGLALAPYLLPLALIGYGVWLLREHRRQGY